MAKKRSKTIKIKLFLTLLCVSCIAGFAWFLFHPGVTDAAWFDDNFKYRIRVSLTNNSAAELTGFQVFTTLDTSTLITAKKMQSSCQDLRVTDANGKTLPYWIEEGSAACNTASTKVWTKIPSLPLSGAVIYLYYGNPSALSLADGNNVFEFFDDFNASLLNTKKWAATGAYSLSGTALTITTGSVYSLNPVSSQPGMKSESRINFTNSSANEGGMSIANSQSTNTANSGSNKIAYFINNSSTFNIGSYASDGSATGYGITSGTTQFTAVSGTNYILGTAISATQVIYYKDRAQTNAYTGTWSSSFYAFLGYYRGSAGATTNATDTTFDWFLVRKHTATEPSTSNAAEEKSPGPIIYWALNEGNGTLGHDSTSNGKNITLAASTSTPLWQEENNCISNKCLQFDGSNDYASVADSGSNDLLDATNLTVSVWIRANGTQSSFANVIDKSHSTGTQTGWALEYATTGDYLYFWAGNGTTNATAQSTTALNDNKWHHIAATYNGTSIYLYVDGRQEGTANISGSLGVNNGSLALGRWETTPGRYFKGFIDEVKIYSYSRTASQIKADYNSKGSKSASAVSIGAVDPARSLSTGLVGYWKMDEASDGTGAVSRSDSSGNGNTLTDNNTTSSGFGKFYYGSDFETDNNESLSITDASQAGLDFGSNFTLSSWINIESFAGGCSTCQMGLITKGTPSSGQEAYALSVGGDNASNSFIRARVSSDGSTSYSLTQDTGTGILTTGKWYLISWVIDGKKSTIYVNGIPVSVSNFSSAPFNGTDPFRVGGLVSNEFDGSLDDVRAYNRALSDSEISSLYDWAPPPTAYWNFDEKSGSTVKDISTNSNTGSWNGTLSGAQWTSGKYGGAGLFNGSDNYISVTNNAGLNNPNGQSIAFWMNTTNGMVQYARIIEKGANNEWAITMNNIADSGKLSVQSPGCCVPPITSTNSVSDGRWHHIGIVLDNDGTIHLYIDGALDGSAASTIFTGTNSIVIGQYGGGGYYYKGMLDDVRYYNYPRTQKQIIADMNAGRPPGDSPVGSALGYWKLDEGAGITANNSGNCSSSCNGTLGDSPAAPSWINTGKFSKALDFDGVNDVVSSPTNTALAITGDLSISAWVNRDTTTSDDPILSYDANGETQATNILYRLQLNQTTNVLELSWETGSGTNITVTSSVAVTTPTGAWQYYAATRDTSSKTVTFFENGKQLGTIQSYSTNPDGGTSSNLAIGSSNTGNVANNYFDGKLDELKLYNYVLNPDEIRLDFNQGKSLMLGSSSTASDGTTAANSQSRIYCVPGDTSTCNTPVGEWNFDEHTGTTAYDTSGNLNNGTLTNGSWKNGKFGSGFASVNSDSIEDSVSITDPVSGILDFSNSQDYSLSMWVKLISSESDAILFYKGGSSDTTSGYDIEYSNSSNVAKCAYSDGNNGNGAREVASSTTNIRDGQWHFITCLMDRSGTATGTAGLYIYVDAKQEGSDLSLSETTGVNSTNLKIGENNNTLEYTGTVDQLRIYDYARTPSQIAWEYNRGAPLGWWKFDECQGTTGYDASGSGYNGTITPGAGSNTSVGSCNSGTSTEMWNDGTTGKYNSALGFDGSDDYVQISDASSLRFDSVTADFSLFAWVKRTTTGTEYIISKEDSDDDGWRLMFNSSNQVICSEDSTDVTGSISVTDTSWHLIGCTIDRNGNGQVYLDGKPDGVAVAMGSDPMSNTSNMRIGTRSYSSTSYFNGLIDDVRIYNYMLTPLQIKTLFNENFSARFGPLEGAP